MDIQHLKYLVMIEKKGSITAAAKALYMNQPNLSRAVREVEQETGFSIFRRTPHGVSLTSRGIPFLEYAKKILSQMHEMESLYKEPEKSAIILDISIPPGSSFSAAIGDYITELPKNIPLSIHCRQTTSLEAIANVSESISKFGIIRYNKLYQDYYDNALKNAQLLGEVLWEFPICLVLGQEHPLVPCGEIPYHMLDSYTEIVYGDISLPPLSFVKISTHAKMKEERRRIHVYDCATQYHLLRNVPGTYLWDAPMPFTMASKYELIQKECSISDGLCRDALIYRHHTPLTPEERRIENALSTYSPISKF